MKENMNFRIYFVLPLTLLAVSLVGISTCNTPEYQGPDVQIIGESFYQDLEFEYERYSYQLDALDEGVPPIILESFPENLADIRSTKERKKVFFKALLPMILLANDEIRVERSKLLELRTLFNNGQSLEEEQLQTIQQLASHYRVKYKTDNIESTLSQLLIRVDIIPTDLALAQAANESGWGTSRFTRVANNIFGEWTFVKGAGIVPINRPAGATYEVQKFATVYDSVRSYLHNLNTHKAYSKLRQIRLESRAAGDNLDGLRLAEGLTLYSIRGEDYVKELQLMIRKNELSRFSSVKLRTKG
ncbi:glucosaminidase domain-containing protein [Verrucomicrobia bacterium]|nr:glucosaminidase domain-containing protein [Verrucomicrobiota bacterium]